MATKYPISKAEFKKRVRLVYEMWPKEHLVARRAPINVDSPGCIMQVCLETDAFFGENMERKVRGVSGETLGDIAQMHDDNKYSQALAAVEAL